MIDISEDDLNTLLVCSARYAVGRRTYITGVIADIIKANVEYIDQHTAHHILEEIELARQHDNLGDYCDVVEWEGVEKALLRAHKGV